MKINLRALFGVSALALLFAASPVLAAEVDVTGENNTTGADSDNENSYDVENDNDTDVDNDADVDNEAEADVETGDNEQEENTTAGDIDTGEVDASTEWETVLNAGAGLAGLNDDLSVDGDFLNDTTGADSNNENELDVENDNDLDLDNWADIFNRLELDADTGDNEQEENTEAGDILTGKVLGWFGITNEANNDAYSGASSSDVEVDVTGENNTTGADSDNENSFDIENDNDVDIDNDADIDNKIEVDANTGHNKQEKNTTAGSIDTGDVDVETDISNSANNGSGAAGAAGSSVEVTADFLNEKTGADSNNDNELDVENSNDVDIENDADVDNDLEVEANTGDNEQEKNTEAGDISTGNVSVSFTVVNELNNN